MTAAILDRPAVDDYSFNWKAHAHIDRYRAADQRDALHTLHPSKMLAFEKALREGRPLDPALMPPRIEKAMFDALGISPFGTQDEVGNLLANAGINRFGSLLIAGGGQAYDHTHTALGAGDTATAATAADTDMGAAVNASNRWFQVADTSYPAFATQVLTVIATFPTGNGNFAWAEWAIAGNVSSAAAAATAPLLNHKIAALGTKTSAAAWAFTVTVTFS